MIFVTLICALIAAALLCLAGLWVRFAPRTAELAHEKALYAAFVADVERRQAKGEIDADAAQEERVQAARALLKAEASGDIETVTKPIYGFVALVITAAAAFGLYLWIGHPSMGDMPYTARLQAWTHTAQTNPDMLPPKALAAVLRQGAGRNSKDAQFWLFMGRVDMLAGNSYDGAKDYEKARDLSPQTFRDWSALGEALVFLARGKGGPDARDAFDKALALEPADARAHYYLGNLDVADGNYDSARTHYQAALAAMTPDDVSRPQVEQALTDAASAETAATAMKTRISGMVAALDAQLKTNPDNPDGWARLLRSYDVLGDTAGRARAVAAMQAHYANRPDVAAGIMARSQSAVGAEAVNQ